MQFMKRLYQLGVLLIPLFIFISLSLILLYTGNGLTQAQTFPVLSGILAYALLLFEVLLAARPKYLEKKLGLPALYAIHGMAALVILAVTFLHAGSAMAASAEFEVWPSVRPTGSLSTRLFLLATVTGAFVLSGVLAQKFKIIARIQRKRKRESSLVIHSLSFLAVALIFIHMLAVDATRENTLFVVLAALYSILTAGYFIYAKIRARHTPEYVLAGLNRQNKNVFDLEFEHLSGTPLDYHAGQYVFLTFTDSALPKQSHPFSISSAPAEDNRLILTVKQNGDYTAQLPDLKAGDKAVLEGPYGHFYTQYDTEADTPLVFLAGGIGITPLMSIIREQVKAGRNRRMILLWALAEKDDVLFLDELESIQKSFTGFSYWITLSREKAEGFQYGRISTGLLEKAGVTDLGGYGEYFLCGPLPMMRSAKKLLLKNGIASEHIHMEEFSF